MASLQTTMAAFNAAIARNSDGYEFRLLLTPVGNGWISSFRADLGLTLD
jgi:hypothetical protein